eukprot:CAMPEP_0175750354 /NCGR_PEP_ID=MMETSP0097-20121207/60633_1 /TAXON_ID=311494 /ORGANISM="Alexandrium monilatum, Strain CCMP3105" /LENGTH=81 /DNA_ID=CAMNT_0017058959 /DNA_START=3 /DNA_END=248 /DNA_ORIENTATION=-
MPGDGDGDGDGDLLAMALDSIGLAVDAVIAQSRPPSAFRRSPSLVVQSRPPSALKLGRLSGASFSSSAGEAGGMRPAASVG